MNTLLSGTSHNPSRLCICAYGQTGSGKTYTMLGGGKYSNRGIIQRCLTSTFQALETLNSTVNPSIPPLSSNAPRTRYVTLAAYQIYDEKVYDLLDNLPKNNNNGGIETWKSITVQEKNNLVYLRNLRVYKIETEADALELIAMAHIARISAATPLNRASSRSHCIITLSIHEQLLSLSSPSSSSPSPSSYTAAPTTDPLLARITLVDLAGSERIYKTGVGHQSNIPHTFTSSSSAYLNPSQITAVRTAEGVGINLSLHYLEACIVALYERNIQSVSLPSSSGMSIDSVPPPHIPFRNSMLTSVLRECLTGACRLVFITTLSPELPFANETASSCRFAARCARLTPIIESRVLQVHQQQQQFFLQQQQKQQQNILLHPRETMLPAKSMGSNPPRPPPLPTFTESITSNANLSPLSSVTGADNSLMDEDKRMIRKYLKEYINGTTGNNDNSSSGKKVETSLSWLPTESISPVKDKSMVRLPIKSLEEAHYALALMRQMVENAIETAAKYANMVEPPRTVVEGSSVSSSSLSMVNDQDSLILPLYGNISCIETKYDNNNNNNMDTSTTLSDDYRGTAASPLRVRGNIQPLNDPKDKLSRTMTDTEFHVTVHDDETINNENISMISSGPEGPPFVSSIQSVRPTSSESSESSPNNGDRTNVVVNPPIGFQTTNETSFQELLSKGNYFIKYPRSSFAKPALRKLWIDFTKQLLCWNDSKPPTDNGTNNNTAEEVDTETHKTGSVPLQSLLEILPGQQTSAFRRYRVPPSRSGGCFSIVSRNRTIDVQVYPTRMDLLQNIHPTKTEKDQRDLWIRALEWLMEHKN